MICFEVRVNGKLVCTAGVGDTGVLSAIVTWVKRDQQACPEDMNEQEWTREDLDVSVGGIEGSINHVSWLRQALRSGDEVSIRVVDQAECDPPVSKVGYQPYDGQNTFKEPNEDKIAERSQHVDPMTGRS